jgi:tRNA-dihydrouridine synthase B
MRVNFKAYIKVMLAPAAGVTDSITRKIARKWGADAVVTEMISSEGLIRKCKKTNALMGYDQSERPLGIQLFGARAEVMAKAAVYAAELKPDFIDLNFGCPAKKVVGKNGGSSMLKNLPELKNIIKLVVDAVNIPVTIKYRSGWDNDSIVAIDVARMAEDMGAAAVCLHPRTRMQGFSGEADWSLIADVKNAIGIPVIGSGDIDSPQKAKEMFDKTGCDTVMICRASFGNPWIFKRTKHYLETGEILPEPNVDTRIDTALEHLRLSIEKFDSFTGLVRMRSQLCWYLKGLPGASKLRSQLVQLPTEDEVIELFENYRQILKDRDYGTKEDSQDSAGCEIRQT